ncbi:MAG: transposase [Kiritimatiellia bacterium]
MPKTARILHPNPDGSGFYHVINRTVANDFLFQDAEKEEFTRLMRKTAAFTGIEILTHVVMSNHYHILLDVPSPGNSPNPKSSPATRPTSVPPTTSASSASWPAIAKPATNPPPSSASSASPTACTTSPPSCSRSTRP